MKLPLATPDGKTTILVTLDVVSADIQALLGMDVLDSECLIADTVASRLVKGAKYLDQDGSLDYFDEWYFPLFRCRGNHVYAKMDCPTSLLFTRSPLHKINRKFFYPSPVKLSNLLRRSRPEETTPETLNILQDLSKRCDTCQSIQYAPTRFRVSFGAEIVGSNERTMLDIVMIDEKPALHTVN